MKTMIKKAGYFLAMFALAACEPFDFEQEMGQKVICIISDNDLVYTGMHDLNQSESTGYISINCGGSLQIDRDVDVTLEYAPEVLQSYNKIKYDIDQSKYAKELPSKYYSIAQMGVTLKAGSPDTYNVMPIQVKPEGLSPDSIYLIPLRIKSVSAYSVNPDKSQVLYQVQMKNLYARTDEATIYNAAGKLQKEGESERDAAASQTFHPLTKNSFRIFAGIKGYEKNEEVIKKNGIIVTVNEDKSHTMQTLSKLLPSTKNNPIIMEIMNWQTFMAERNASVLTSNTNTASKANRNGKSSICALYVVSHSIRLMNN